MHAIVVKCPLMHLQEFFTSKVDYYSLNDQNNDTEEGS